MLFSNEVCDEFSPFCLRGNHCCAPLWGSKAPSCPHLWGAFPVYGNFSSFSTTPSPGHRFSSWKTLSLLFPSFPLFYKNVFYFIWRITALQYCVGFCHTSTWISHRYIYVPSLVNLPPTFHPSHISRSLQSPSLSYLRHTASPHWLSIYIWQCICFHATLPISPILSFLPLPCVHKSVLYVYIFTAALKIGSSVSSF